MGFTEVPAIHRCDAMSHPCPLDSSFPSSLITQEGYMSSALRRSGRGPHCVASSPAMPRLIELPIAQSCFLKGQIPF